MTLFLWNGRRPIGTMKIMAHTSSVYATLIAPSVDLPEGLKCSPREFARPLRLTNSNFSAAASGHHALGSVARNEDSPRRRHRRVASEVLR
jgi:hypothetical protein